MKKLAILKNNIGMSQSSYFMIRSLNEMATMDQVGCCVMIGAWSIPPVKNLFGLLQQNEIFDFEGVGIATNIETAQKLISVPGPKKKYFYIWDIEWTKLKAVNYNQLSNIYCNSQLELIVRSEHHAKLIKDCFKEPCHIMEDWDIEVLRKLV